MFARITILQVKPDSIDRAINLFRTSVVPEVKKQRGYRGASLLVDRKAGKGMAMTFWRTEKDALANERSLFYQEQLVKFLGYFSGPPIREGYAVSVQTMSLPAPKTSRRIKPKPVAGPRKGSG
jgi:heme-degrading monooxygenase HmoA